MKFIAYLLYALSLLTLLVACADETPVKSHPESSAKAVDEPVDVTTTQNLQASLMRLNDKFGESKNQSIDVTIETELVEQTDAERQSLIDNTLENSTQKLDDQADKMAESLEELKEIEHAPIPDSPLPDSPLPDSPLPD